MVIVKVVSINGKTTTIPITNGSVTVDRKSTDARRTLSFTTNIESLVAADGTVTNIVPQVSTDPLNIYGNHVYVYRGILWNLNGIDPKLYSCSAPIPADLLKPTSEAYELVPLGVFRINSVSISEQSEGELDISVEGSDLSANISKNAWLAPVTVWKTAYTVPVKQAGTTVAEQKYVANTVKEALMKLIIDRFPQRNGIFGPLNASNFNFSGVGDKVLVAPVVMGSNTVSSSGSNSPWTDITSLAQALGAELFIGADGRFTLRRIEDPNSIAPVWDLLDGDTNGNGGLLVSASRKISADNTRNYVIATGENTATKKPLRAVAFDNDPNSPTYHLGTFGKVVGWESGKKKLTTQAEVQNAADTYLNYFIGGDETAGLSAIVNPALDVGDVIRVRRRRIGIFNPEAVIAALSADTGTKAISQLKVTPLKYNIRSGEKVTIYTDFKTQEITTSRAHAKGDVILYVNTFTPKADFRKGTVITDPAIPSNGSVNYFIDQLTIPLDLESPMAITVRERRVGSRRDTILTGQYE
jgi:hypothetical protein